MSRSYANLPSSQVKEDRYELIDKELLEFVEDVLLNRCENATERMLEYAATLEPKCKPTAVRKLGTGAAAAAKAKGDSWRDLTVRFCVTLHLGRLWVSPVPVKCYAVFGIVMQHAARSRALPLL